MKTREQIIALAKLHFAIGHPVDLDGVLGFAAALGHEVSDGPRHHRITIGDTFEVNGPDMKDTPAWRVAPAPIERVGHPLHFRVIEKATEGYGKAQRPRIDYQSLLPMNVATPDGHHITMDGILVNSTALDTEQVWLTGPRGARVLLNSEGAPIMATLTFRF